MDGTVGREGFGFERATVRSTVGRSALATDTRSTVPQGFCGAMSSFRKMVSKS